MNNGETTLNATKPTSSTGSTGGIIKNLKRIFDDIINTKAIDKLLNDLTETNYDLYRGKAFGSISDLHRSLINWRSTIQQLAPSDNQQSGNLKKIQSGYRAELKWKTS